MRWLKRLFKQPKKYRFEPAIKVMVKVPQKGDRDQLKYAPPVDDSGYKKCGTVTDREFFKAGGKLTENDLHIIVCEMHDGTKYMTHCDAPYGDDKRVYADEITLAKDRINEIVAKHVSDLMVMVDDGRKSFIQIFGKCDRVWDLKYD